MAAIVLRRDWFRDVIVGIHQSANEYHPVSRICGFSSRRCACDIDMVTTLLGRYKCGSKFRRDVHTRPHKVKQVSTQPLPMENI